MCTDEPGCIGMDTVLILYYQSCYVVGDTTVIWHGVCIQDLIGLLLWVFLLGEMRVWRINRKTQLLLSRAFCHEKKTYIPLLTLFFFFLLYDALQDSFELFGGIFSVHCYDGLDAFLTKYTSQLLLDLIHPSAEHGMVTTDGQTV